MHSLLVVDGPANTFSQRNANAFQRMLSRNGGLSEPVAQRMCVMDGPTPTTNVSLKTLKPRLSSIDTRKVPMLEAKAGTTVRMRGEKWTKIRRKVLVEGGFTCVDCGRVNASNQIDHEVPLEQGGSYDRANLKIRCVECHAAKTTSEQRARIAR